MVRVYSRSAAVCVALLLLIMGVCTLRRSMLWRTNLGLIGDTVKKSPGFKMIRVDYMVAMIGRKDLKGAKAQYEIAQKIPSVEYLEALDLNMAAIYFREGNEEQADKLYQYALKKTHGKSVVAYGAYISFLEDCYGDARKKNDGSDAIPGAALIENMEKLYRLNKNPMLLYRTGQLAIALGRCDDALRLFTEAGRAFSTQSEYARISGRLAASLASGSCRQESL